MKVATNMMLIVFLMKMLLAMNMAAYFAKTSPAQAFPNNFYFSHNYSVSAIEKAWLHFPTKGVKYFHNHIDLSGDLYTAKATNNRISMYPGSILNMSTLPQNSGKYEEYLKEAVKFTHDDEEFYDDSDYVDDNLKPKHHESDDNEGYVDIAFDEGYEEDPVQLKKKSSDANTTTKQYDFYSYKREYRNEKYINSKLGQHDGLLSLVRNATFRIQSTLKISDESYEVDMKMTNVTFNRTIHYDYKKGGLELISSICKIRSRLNVIVNSDKKKDAKFLNQINVHEMVSKELCRLENKYTRIAMEFISSPEKLVINLHNGLYLDMRMFKPVLTNSTISIMHVAEFIHDPEKIKGLVGCDNFSYHIGTESTMPFFLRAMQNYMTTTKSEMICDLFSSCNKEVIEKVTKEYILVDNMTPLSGCGKDEEGEDLLKKTSREVLLKMSLDERMLNSLMEGIIITNLTNLSFNQTDVENGCHSVSWLYPLCNAIKKCDKVKEIIMNKFNFNIMGLRNPNVKYFTFQNGVISSNTSYAITLNQQTANMTIAFKLISIFEGDKYSYKMLFSSIKLTASSQFHSYLDEKSMKKMVKDILSYTFSIPSPLKFYSDTRNGKYMLDFDIYP